MNPKLKTIAKYLLVTILIISGIYCGCIGFYGITESFEKFLIIFIGISLVASGTLIILIGSGVPDDSE